MRFRFQTIQNTCISLTLGRLLHFCITFHRNPVFSKRYSVLCKVFTGYHGTSEIEHGLCACTVDNPLAKARGLSLRTGAQTMLYLSLIPRFEYFAGMMLLFLQFSETHLNLFQISNITYMYPFDS